MNERDREARRLRVDEEESIGVKVLSVTFSVVEIGLDRVCARTGETMSIPAAPASAAKRSGEAIRMWVPSRGAQLRRKVVETCVALSRRTGSDPTSTNAPCLPTFSLGARGNANASASASRWRLRDQCRAEPVA